LWADLQSYDTSLSLNLTQIYQLINTKIIVKKLI
jgi:hypothetical protein